MREQVISSILEHKVIAIARRLDPGALQDLAAALLRGGIRLMELTFDQQDPGSWPGTCAAIDELGRRFAGELLVGAGTVLTAEQAAMARDAGALYIISPNADPEVIRASRAMGLVSIPGCMAPTEIASALSAGADFVKLFPAGQLGADYVRAVRAPLPHARMLAVGGVNEGNARDFIVAGCLGVGAGGNLAHPERIARREFGPIEALARAYVRAVNP